MGRVEYLEIQCRSALNRVHGMPFRWSLNPYIGCAHACQYCYARAYYAVAEHGDPGADFQTRILVKVNLPEVLRRELARPGWRFEQVALGTATDVYQPAEGRFRVTRRCLEALRDAGNSIGMVTKSPLVLRDLDILADLATAAPVRVFFTITTVDLDLWRRLEPGTANPFKRLQVMRRLNEAGVPAGVLLAPILPGVTDSVASVAAVAEAARAHGARFFGHSALRLGPVVREHYLSFVAAAFPHLLSRYQRAYRGTYVARDYQRALDARVDRVRERYGFAADSMRRGEPENRHGAAAPAGRRGRQLPLPIA